MKVMDWVTSRSSSVCGKELMAGMLRGCLGVAVRSSMPRAGAASMAGARQAASSPAPTVLVEQQGSATVITLNRPSKHNALTLQMVRELTACLKDPGHRTTAVNILVGAGDKAFCAGGDVAAVREAGLSVETSLTRSFFFEEYQLNELMSRVDRHGNARWCMHARARARTRACMCGIGEKVRSSPCVASRCISFLARASCFR